MVGLGKGMATTLLCLIAALCVIGAPPVSGHADDDAAAKARLDAKLKQICARTDHPVHCLSNISPFVHGRPTVDTALDASIKAAANFAKYALAQVKQLAKKAPADMSSTYKDCVDFYENALEGFGETLAAHPARDMGTMETQLSGVITWLSTCEDEFSEAGGPSPLTGYASTLQSMTDDSLAIVQQIH